ncbi:MAG: type I-E CRISPR-associated protein Cse1/CasA [Methylovulum sp.]
MQIENKFSLIDSPWLPIADVGRVSLKQIFSDPSYRALGGNPIQKVAITKLLLAIAQAACTPEDNDAWEALGSKGLAQNCSSYLEKHYNKFYLYGENPFLQMSEISKAATQSIGAVLPEIATGNTTILNALQIETELSDADKALLIVQLMGFGLGGKKTDNSIVLSAGYSGKSNDKGKASTGKAGASLGFMGFLHNFLQGQFLLETLWLNLFTQEQIQNLPYANGLGVAPWEDMPKGEQCETAKGLQNSLMGRLLPLSRFCLLNDKGLHYSEGITHLDYKFGMIDPSVAINPATKPAKVLWVDTERRPWRFLTALLSFMEANSGGFECPYIKQGLLRARKVVPQCGLWSGGLRVSSNAGEQYVSGSDDFLESVTFMDSDYLGEPWYNALKQEMSELDQLAKIVYGVTMSYFKSLKVEGKSQAAAASNLFWQLSERKFQDLVNACGQGEEQTKALRKDFAQFASTAYNTYCPNDTARQLNAWAENLPNLSKYLKNAKQPEAKV